MFLRKRPILILLFLEKLGMFFACGKYFPVIEGGGTIIQRYFPMNIFVCFIKKYVLGMLKTETDGVPAKQFKHNKELFSCDKCEYVTLTQIALLNHTKTRHERGRPTCVLCGLMFKTKFDLARHRRQKHWSK